MKSYYEHQLFNQRAQGPLLKIISNPKYVLLILKVVWRVVEFAYKHFYTKDGNPRTPFFVKIGAALGFKVAKEMKEICDEAVKCNEQIMQDV
jgi:hypothetical protein